MNEPERVVVPVRESIINGVERLNVPNELNEMSLIGQFFVAPCVLVDNRTPNQVPVFAQRDRETLLKEVGPHVTNCKIMHFQDSERTVAILTGVRTNSQDLFLRLRQEGNLHPLVTDLYPEAGCLHQHSKTNVPVLYEINKESLDVSEPQGFRELWSFISNTFVREESHFTVMPRGWDFGEHVTKSLYLQALNGVCSKIRLYVDPQSNRVTAISGVL